MFCDGCGAAVQSGQAFCSKCGKQIVGPISLMQPRPGRVREHVRLLSLFWLALSAFNTIGGIALYVVANTVLVHKAAQEGGPPAFLTPLLSAVAILLLAKAAFGFIAGWGLLQHEHWGSGRRSRPGVRYIVYQHSVRNGARHLYDVGSAARGIGAGI